MRLIPSTLSLLFAISTVAAAQTPIFDCGRAQTPREHTVCDSTKLSALDVQMAQAYKTLEASLSQASAESVKADQREWLQWLDKVCPPSGDRIHDATSCLMERYDTRLSEIEDGIQHADSLVIYPRGHFVFVAGQANSGEEHARNDPGYGYGEFSWPQIDNPTPAQKAWNEAVYAATVKNAGSWRETPPSNIEGAVNSGGSLYSYYIFLAVDNRFVDVQLGNSTYGWGAAHPNSSITSFAWWLGKGRALQADDLFATGSGWHETLAALTLAKLEHNPGPDALWQPGKNGETNELHDAIAEGVVQPGAWTLSFEGLTITFGAYAVGPYSSGMPSAHFTWQELRPMLAAGFDPHSMPPPLAAPK